MKSISVKYILLTILLSASNIAMADCIGVVTAGGGVGFWGEVIKGAHQAGNELGIEVYARGAVDEANMSGQRQVINFIMKQGCKGLVLAPNSDERKNDVARLKAQGIPTVYIDRDMAGDRVSVIKTENFAAGEFAGTKMAKALNGQGNVALLRLNSDVVSTTAREKGFIKGAIQGGLDIVIDRYIGTMVTDARTNAFAIFKSVKDVDGVFTPNESTSLGVLKALILLNKAGEIIHIGFDAHKEMINALTSNHMHGFIVQQPFKMGYQGVITAQRAIQGKPIKSQISTDVIFVHRKNIKDKNIRNILGLDSN